MRSTQPLHVQQEAFQKKENEIIARLSKLHREDAKKDQEEARSLERKVNKLDAQLLEQEKEMNAIMAR